MTLNQYPPQPGTWTLVAPDGRRWTGRSPFDAVRAEQRERIPATVALQRVLLAASEIPIKDKVLATRLRSLADGFEKAHQESGKYRPLFAGDEVAATMREAANVLMGEP